MNINATKLGFYSAATAFIASVGYSVAQILQVLGLVVFPWGEILIYGFSLCIAAPFMLALLALHYSLPKDKKIWSHTALLFAVMYAVYVTFVYTVQLGVAIPMTLNGKAAAIQVLILTEHSFFWALDGLGYLCMGVSTLFVAFSFSNKASQRWLRGVFLANALLTPIIAVVYFYPHFSIALLLIASPWIITLPGSMILLALFFKKRLNKVDGRGVYKPKTSLQNLEQ